MNTQTEVVSADEYRAEKLLKAAAGGETYADPNGRIIAAAALLLHADLSRLADALTGIDTSVSCMEART